MVARNLLAAKEKREWVTAGVGLLDLTDLNCVVDQIVVQNLTTVSL